MSENPPRPYGTLILFLFWALLLGAVFLWMQPDKAPPPDLRAVLRPTPKPLQAFTLTDQDNAPFGLDALKGKWNFVFFGYTYCPDICPTTLSVLARAMKTLRTTPRAPSNLQVVFVSVDPQRDTPALLKKYLAYFNPAFRGITGEQQAIDALTRQFGAGYLKDAETAPGVYQVSHTSSNFLVDPRGRLVATFAPPHAPDRLVEQFLQIQALF